MEFLSQSQVLVLSHLNDSSTTDTDEYKNYIRTFNEIQIISSDEIRLSAYKLLESVSHFIVLRKNDQEAGILKGMRNSVDENTGFFQKLVQLEVTKAYKKT